MKSTRCLSHKLISTLSLDDTNEIICPLTSHLSFLASQLSVTEKPNAPEGSSTLLDNRAQVVNWMWETAIYFGYFPLTFVLAVEILDRCIYSTDFRFDRQDLLITSTASLYLAVKMNESRYLSLEDVIKVLCEGRVSADSLVDCELFILKLHNYRLPRRDILLEMMTSTVSWLFWDKKCVSTVKDKSKLFLESVDIPKGSKQRLAGGEDVEITCLACEYVYSLILFNFDVAWKSKRVPLVFAIIYYALKKLEESKKISVFPRASFFDFMDKTSCTLTDYKVVYEKVFNLLEKFVDFRVVVSSIENRL